MKIALDMRTLNVVTGGVERYTKRLYKELLSLENELFYPFPFDLENNLGFKNSLKFSFEMSTSDWNLSMKTELLLAELNDIDLLFSPYIPLSSLGNYKKVLTIHDIIPLTVPELVSSPSSIKFLDEDIRKSSITCDLILTDSYFSKKEIVEYFKLPEEKVRVLYLGHDIEKTDAANEQEHLKILSLINKDYLLSVGALEKRKNLVKVLELFTEIKKINTYAKYKLVLTGSLRGENTDFSLIYETHPFKDDIIITGYVDDEVLATLYKNTKLFLFLSLYEGFGLPVLEAMALGAPVITSNNSSLPEVGGDAVMYCDPLNIDSIVTATKYILENESIRQQMIEKGKERATQFTWRKTAIGVLEILKSLC